MSPDVPELWEVVDNRSEATEVVTIAVRPVRGAPTRFLPAQFSMIGIPGVGEVPVSISSSPKLTELHEYTIRLAGAVTARLVVAERGDLVTVRGPLGKAWDLDSALGRPLLFLAGGIGIAPLKAAILEAVDRVPEFGKIHVVLGAMSPDSIVYREWLEMLRREGVDVRIAVEVPGTSEWRGPVGRVTEILPGGDELLGAEVFMCGPDAMMTAAVHLLDECGVQPDRVQVTLERNMHCGTGTCGHCQLGPVLLCRDGPVFRADEVVELLGVAEL